MNNAVSGRERGLARFESLTQRLDLEGGERWFAARTLSHRENSAHFNLHCLGFRSFVPRFRRTIRHANKLRNVLAPLFPGYIFVILDLSRDRWRSVNSTTGVASLIMGVEQPLSVPPGVVEALIVRSENSGTIASIATLRSVRGFAYFRDPSPRPFVVSSILTTEGACESCSKSWADKSWLKWTGQPLPRSIPGQKVVDPVHRMIGGPRRHVGQRHLRIDVFHLRRDDEAVQSKAPKYAWHSTPRVAPGRARPATFG